jgi:hypothetical protein
VNCQNHQTINVNGVGPNSVLYIQGSANNMHCDFHTTNLMIYVTGFLDYNAQSDSSFQAPTTGNWAGMALWMAGTSGSPHLNGGGTSQTIGTIYAPHLDLTINGNSGQAMRAQLIANTFSFIGTSDNIIIYDPSVFFQLPPYVSISE